MRLAVITGASSGLGREFALQITKKYADEFDEMWLIARRREQLEELAAQILALCGGQSTDAADCTPADFAPADSAAAYYAPAFNAPANRARAGHVTVRAVPLDLTSAADLDRFEKMLSEANAASETPSGSPASALTVTWLVNAAGLGRFGRSEDIPRSSQRGMIDLNCGALVEVTAICVPYLARKAHVLQIASTAGFQPFQFLNIYAATKAFVLRYSQALAWELAGRRVRVTAVCPYWVKDTEFIGIAKETGGKRANRHYPLASKTKNVVARALAVNRTGYWVATPSLVSFVHRIWTKISPTAAQMGVYELIRRL